MKYSKMMKMIAITVIAVMSLLSSAQAGPIAVSSATGAGSYQNAADLLVDGYVPAEWTVWTAGTNVWWYGTEPAFTLDFGGVYRLEGILIQVDNNDWYKIEYSLNNSTWNELFVIPSYIGDVGWGMDTFTPPEIAFAPVNARYIRAFAIGGDNCYAISEIQAFGTTANSVPEPTTMLLLGFGLIGLAGVRRKFKN
jgi:hypothetical protein